MSGKDRERLARNDESRNRADKHREPWSGEELEFLLEFWQDPTTSEAEVAETLGRTIEACRQRFYETLHGRPVAERTTTTTATTTTTTTRVYRGACDDPDECWWDPEYYERNQP